jgi:hypothetical protein
MDDDEVAPETDAERQWLAENVDPYRGVPLPEIWPAWRFNPAMRDAWRAGVDAALEVNAEIIRQCNDALQRVTGGHRGSG